MTEQIVNLFRAAYFGGNWTGVSLKETVAELTWQQATRQVYSCNTIAALVYHINYYVRASLHVLEGKPINAHDKYSYDLPPIQSAGDWAALLNETWANADNFIRLVEQLPESKLLDVFVQEKYGNYYRNLHGIIEHTHYHLGQIALIKKIQIEMDRA